MGDLNLPKKSPWGVVAPPTNVTSLMDVMSEQLADDLQLKEEASLVKEALKKQEGEAGIPTATAAEEPEPNPFDGGEVPDCSNDLMLAQILQLEFDKDHDAHLKSEQDHRNGTSKVTVSYEKYRKLPNSDEDEEDPDLVAYLALDDSELYWDCYEAADREAEQIPRCGYKKKVDGSTITKHDREINHRSNGKKVMAFPPGILTGDGGGMDIQLPNKVFNELSCFSNKELKRRAAKVRDKVDHGTVLQAVDPTTKLVLFKLVNQEILDDVRGIISSGKEAIIFHANGGPGPDPEDESDEAIQVPHEVAIKVFKTTLNEFKTREKYIKDDYRFKARFSKQNPRQIIHMWAEKELHNLMKMWKHGIRVPEPVLLKKHVLLMEFIGSGGEPAPKLREVNFDYAQLEVVYEEVVDMMHKLYNECGLVHADLSEYNILYHDNHCYLIDVSQSVEPTHPEGLEFLYRDCTNICSFFERRGIENCHTPQSLFTEITGLPLGDDLDDEQCPKSEAEILSRVRNYEKNNEILSLSCRVPEFEGQQGFEETFSAKHYPFDFCWDQSLDRREKAASSAASAPRAIPGHPRRSSKRGGKSPKSPKTPIMKMLSKSPGNGGGSSSSKSPKSPGRNLATLTNEELKDLKEALVSGEKEKEEVAAAPKKVSVVKFVEENDED